MERRNQALGFGLVPATETGIPHPYRVLQDGSFVATKGTITGTIYANAGTIGGFAIASGRIGVASSSGATTGSGFSLYSSFIKFSELLPLAFHRYKRASIFNGNCWSWTIYKQYA